MGPKWFLPERPEVISGAGPSSFSRRTGKAVFVLRMVGVRYQTREHGQMDPRY